MANPNRGEVSLVAGETTFTLVFTINSVCELEDVLEKGINEIVADMGKVKTIRALLWAGLRHHHPMTLEEAGDLMQKAGAAATGAAINKAVTLAFPPEDKAAGANPQ